MSGVCANLFQDRFVSKLHKRMLGTEGGESRGGREVLRISLILPGTPYIPDYKNPLASCPMKEQIEMIATLPLQQNHFFMTLVILNIPDH